eukprot:257883-Pleurochrysis_carterae.AAC.3
MGSSITGWGDHTTTQGGGDMKILGDTAETRESKGKVNQGYEETDGAKSEKINLRYRETTRAYARATGENNSTRGIG